MAQIAQPRRLLFVALLVGWGFDLLFYEKPLGVSVLLFVGLICGALVGVGWQEKILPQSRAFVWLFPLGFCAGTILLRDNLFLTSINLVAVILLLTYFCFFYATGQFSNLTLFGAAFLPARVATHSLIEGIPVLADARLSELRQSGFRQILPIVRGILLAVPILLLFTFLLSSADLVFEQQVEDFFDLELFDDLAEWFWRLVLIFVVAYLAAGGIAYSLKRAGTPDDPSLLEKGLEKVSQPIRLGFTETGTILLLVNLLFAAFVAIQFTYLFGGEQNINIEGYTYSDYARRGFFELVAVAVLSLSLILGLHWLIRHASSGQQKWFNGLSSLMIGFVMVMLVSAFRRMNLYETTYGYTELRLYVYLFIGWLGLLLLWFLVSLWLNPRSFLLGLVVCAFGFLATLTIINPDAWIVKQNLVRYAETGDLDVVYLTTLSTDAVPALLQARTLVKDDLEEVLTPACAGYWWHDEANQDEECLATRYTILTDDLIQRMVAMEENPDWQKWASFHWSRWQAYQLLTGSGIPRPVKSEE